MIDDRIGVCPYCGKSIDEEERFCYFCEQDISKAKKEEEKTELMENTEII